MYLLQQPSLALHSLPIPVGFIALVQISTGEQLVPAIEPLHLIAAGDELLSCTFESLSTDLGLPVQLDLLLLELGFGHDDAPFQRMVL